MKDNNENEETWQHFRERINMTESELKKLRIRLFKK